jgi:hypothetical protein
MGRAGRLASADPSTDYYYVCYSLSDYAYFLQRIYKVDKSHDFAESDKILSLQDYQATLASNLQEVLAFCVLPTECRHVAHARKLGNPFMAEHNRTVEVQPCRITCDYCLRSETLQPPPTLGPQAAFPAIAKVGVKRVLLDLFLGDRMLLKPVLDGNLIEALRTYPEAQSAFFESSSTKPPQPKQVKQLILLLLATKILCHKIFYKDDDVDKKTPILLARLNYDAEMNL